MSNIYDIKIEQGNGTNFKEGIMVFTTSDGDSNVTMSSSNVYEGTNNFFYTDDRVKNSPSITNLQSATTGINNTLIDLQNQISNSGTSSDLQTAYNNSTTPEITTDATRGAFTIQNGQALDAENVYEGKNIAGTTTSEIRGDGSANFQGQLDISGDIVVTGNVDGRDVSIDGTKLDTIETNADVTDTANVDSAGATMNTDTTLVGNSYFLDDDTFSANDATKVPSQQSVKSYVDSHIAGVQAKEAVRVGTTSYLDNIGVGTWTKSGSGVGKTLTAGSVGIVTMDGVALLLGDRILIKDEDGSSTNLTNVDNGIYTVTTEGTVGVVAVFTRATDFDGDPIGEVTQGSYCFILDGTTQNKTGWMVQATSSITVDTDPIIFVQFQGLPANHASTHVTGGIDKIRDATASQDGLMTTAYATKLDGIETGATTDQTDSEIETAYNNQVDAVSQIEAEAGTNTTIRRWTAERVKQAIVALSGVGLTDGDKGDITVSNSGSNWNIDAGVVDSTELANFAVTTGKLAQNTVTLDRMAKYTAGSLISYDGANDPQLIPVGTSGYVLTSNGTGTIPTYQSIDDLINGASDGDKGDITVSNSGSNWTINNDSVTNAKLDNMAQATIKGRASGAGTGDPTDLSATQVRTIINVEDGANNYTHPNHTGDVTSTNDGATVAQSTMISGKSANSGLVGTEEVLINNSGTLEKITTQEIADLGSGSGTGGITPSYADYARASKVSGNTATTYAVSDQTVPLTLESENSNTNKYTVTGNGIRVNQNGRFTVSGNVTITSSVTQRANPKLKIAVNGTIITDTNGEEYGVSNMYARFTANANTSSAQFNITLDLNNTDIVTLVLTQDGGEDDAGVVINSTGTWLELTELLASGITEDVTILKGTSGLVKIAHTITGWQSLNYQESFAHGFGTEPDWVHVELVCTSANNGYSVGDTLDLKSTQNYVSTGEIGANIKYNSTQVEYVGANNANPLRGFQRDGTNDNFNLQDTEWDIKITAYKGGVEQFIAFPRVESTNSVATLVINADTTDTEIITALATPLDIDPPSGTPKQGQRLVIRILDDGSARAISWDAGVGGFRPIGVTLPLTTTISKYLYIGALYNATDDKWDVVAVNEEA
jgi:hypothetical protein